MFVRKALVLLITCFGMLNIVFGQNLLCNSSFELFNTGYSAYMTAGNGSATGMPCQWQLVIVGNNYPSCSNAACGTSQVDSGNSSSGNKSLQVNITKQTNRNDVRLFQSISSVPDGKSFVVSLYMKGDRTGYPVTVNVFKSTEVITSNGSCNVSSPCQTFTLTDTWQQYKMYVDLSTWTSAERNNMRISIRPNTSTALPAGPYPKTFWFDDITFGPVDAKTELKDAAIQVAIQRRDLAKGAGYIEEANALTAEIEELKNSNPSLPIVPLKAIGFNPSLTQTTEATNPFIKAIHTWAANYLATSFNGFPKSSPGNTVFPNSYDARSLGTVLENLHWLIVSPYSAYRYDPELLRRFLTIAYATSDDYRFNASSTAGIPGSTANAMNDWFAAPKICYSWRMAEVSFDDYIPATMKLQLREAADSLGTNFYKRAVAEVDSFLYTNRDISYAEALMHAGMYRNRNTWIDMSKRIIDSVYLVSRLPDGAYHYRKNQNETTNYHGGTNNSLAKIWSVSEYRPAWNCIAQTGNYELLSIEPLEVPEYYTVPAWKTQWNAVSGISAEPLLSITRSPYLKTRYDLFRAADGYDDEMPLSASFYNADITSLPLPDSYIVYDRNIQGPRARYKRFSFAATGRCVAGEGDNDPGLQTIVGAMETKPGTNTNIDEMDAALMAVHSKVHVRNSNPQQQWTDWAYMMSATDAKVCVGKNVAAISTPSILQYQLAGPVGIGTNWASFQQWITLPDRMIGLVEVYPKNNNPAQAFEIDGRVRFTYGRSGPLTPKYLVEEEAGKKYAYGKFKAIVHAHDFTSITTDTAGVLRDDTRHAMEIIFRYNKSSGSSLYNYPADTKKYFIIEIRDSAAIGDAVVTRTNVASVKGLVVKLNGKSYASYRNDGDATTVDLSNVLMRGNTNQVLFSRKDSISRMPEVISTSSLEIPANEQVLMVSTNDPLKDTGRGYQNFDELLLMNSLSLLPTRVAYFTGASSNCNTTLQWNILNNELLDSIIVEKASANYHFLPVGIYKSTCSSSTPCSYNATFNQQEKTAYYRLKLVNKAGSVQFTNAVLVASSCSVNKRLTVSPNPATAASASITFTYFNDDRSGNGTLQLLDASGKHMFVKNVVINPNKNSFTVACNLHAGLYIARLQTNNSVEFAEVIVQ